MWVLSYFMLSKDDSKPTIDAASWMSKNITLAHSQHAVKEPERRQKLIVYRENKL